MSTESTIHTRTDLTAGWLSAVLGAPVAAFDADRIGTGQMSESYRVHVKCDSPGVPASVVLKIAASDPMSRQTGAALGLYEREVRFYAEVAPRIGGPVAPCYHASYDAEKGTFTLLLGDAGPAEVGDEIAGTSLDRALLAVTELGRLQGPVLGDSALAGAAWLNRDMVINQGLMAQLYAGFLDRYADRIAPPHRAVCDRLVASFDAYAAGDDGPQGLVHGDYRLDNLLFGAEGADRPLTVVDWQTVAWGPAMTDLAYFLGCALRTEVRREHGGELIAAYHRALGDGRTTRDCRSDEPRSVTIDDVRAGVRRTAFFGVMMAIVSPMLVARTERGDEMFMTMIARHCAHVLDTGALDLLPESTVPQPLVPAPDDEAPHPPTGEPLWNESWYCDFVDAGHDVGGYVRVGLMPNEGVAWLTVVVCGPDRPTVAIIDFAAPVNDPYTIHANGYEFTHAVSSPLQRYHVGVGGQGEAYDDPAALLRGERGRAVDVALDLTWTTAGAPYQYRLTPRYEIPCTVTGTVTVDGQAIQIADAPGQRDHSWGVRDWWAMDWVWSALHLDDGTHVHALDLRIPGAPPIGVGYRQRAGAPLTELTAVTARESFADNGLPVAATITIEPGPLETVAQIRGHGPLRLVAPDGRVAEFARAWARITTPEGHRGVGWIEWNRNNPR